MAIFFSPTFTFDRSGTLLGLGDGDGLPVALGVVDGLADGEGATLVLPEHAAVAISNDTKRAGLRGIRPAYGGRLSLELVTPWPLPSDS